MERDLVRNRRAVGILCTSYDHFLPEEAAGVVSDVLPSAVATVITFSTDFLACCRA
jgi:hypothetical protein